MQAASLIGTSIQCTDKCTTTIANTLNSITSIASIGSLKPQKSTPTIHIDNVTTRTSWPISMSSSVCRFHIFSPATAATSDHHRPLNILRIPALRCSITWYNHEMQNLLLTEMFTERQNPNSPSAIQSWRCTAPPRPYPSWCPQLLASKRTPHRASRKGKVRTLLLGVWSAAS